MKEQTDTRDISNQIQKYDKHDGPDGKYYNKLTVDELPEVQKSFGIKKIRQNHIIIQVI